MWLLAQGAQAQFAFVRYDHGTNTAQVKWMSETLISTEGVDIYRAQNKGQWEKLNAAPIVFKGDEQAVHALTPEETSILNTLGDPGFEYGKEAIPTLVILNRVVPSENLSKAIGIQYTDRGLSTGNTYQYKITEAGNEAVEIARSEAFDASADHVASGPSDIEYKEKNRAVSIGWANESQRYYGVNVYRTKKDQPETRIKLNKQPVLYSGGNSDNTKRESWQFVDETIEKKAEYEYALVAVDYFGREAGKTEDLALGWKDIIPPSEPTDIILEPDGITMSIGVSWKAVIDEDHSHFEIRHATLKGAELTTVRNNISSDSTYAIIPVAGIGMHFMQVIAHDQHGNSTASEVISELVKDEVPPAVPTGLNIQMDSGKVTLTWSANTEADLAGYVVHGQKSAGGPFYRLTSKPITGTTFTETFPAKRVAKLSYRIQACDTTGNKSTASVIVSTEMKDHNPPQPPRLETIGWEEQMVKLTWMTPADVDLSGFQVQRMNTVDSTWSKANFSTISAASKSFNDRGAKPGNSYVYRVTAYDTLGNMSEVSNLKKITVPTEKSALEITTFDVSLNKRSGQVKLEWEVNAPDEVLAYMLFASTDGSETAVPITGKIQAPFYTEKLNEPGTRTYTLKVYDKRGKKHLSEPQTITLQSKK